MCFPPCSYPHIKWISWCTHSVFIPVDIVGVEDGILGLVLEPINETVGVGVEGGAGNKEEEMGGGMINTMKQAFVDQNTHTC